jgi:hypothetical protein
MTSTTPDLDIVFRYIMSQESDYIFFWDHVVSNENPYHLAVFSQWYPLSFTDPKPSPKDPHPDPSLVFTSSEIYMSKSPHHHLGLQIER